VLPFFDEVIGEIAGPSPDPSTYVPDQSRRAVDSERANNGTGATDQSAYLELTLTSRGYAPGVRDGLEAAFRMAVLELSDADLRAFLKRGAFERVDDLAGAMRRFTEADRSPVLDMVGAAANPLASAMPNDAPPTITVVAPATTSGVQIDTPPVKVGCSACGMARMSDKACQHCGGR
jgi:hypothetical protein